MTENDHTTDQGPYRPTVRTQAELEQVWRHLMGPLGFSGSSIWFLYIDSDDRVLPRIAQVEECDALPDEVGLTNFADLLRQLEDDLLADAGEQRGRWALLRSRPGRGGPDQADRAWASGLATAIREAGLVCEVMHLATDSDLMPLPMDTLASR